MRKLLITIPAFLLLATVACGGGKGAAEPPKAPAAAPPPPGQTAPAPAPQAKPLAPAAPAAPTPKYGGTLVFRQRADPLWDPAAGLMASDEGRVFHLVYARLFTLHRGPPLCQLWPPDPELAESWRWVDQRTLEVKLRSGAKFSDAPPMNGREITADDVVNSFQRVFRLLPGAKPAVDLTESVTALDKLTVRFTLKKPFPTYMEDVLGQRWTIVMPKEITPPTVSMKATDHIGTASGAFIMKSYSPSTSIEFVKNPNYFAKGLPYLDGITQPIMPDESTMVAGFRAGKVDAGEVRTSQFIAELQRTDPKLQHQVCPYPAPFVVDLRGDRPPLNNLKVRQALSRALDRDALGKIAWAGQYFPKYSPVHQGLGDWALQLKDYTPEAAKILTYNPAEAKRLMVEAGYPGGFEATLNFSPAFPGQSAIAEFLSSAWQEIGVKVKLKPLDRPSFSAISTAPQGGDWGDMGVFFASSATVYEALFHYFKSGLPRNLSRINDPDVDRLVAQMLTTADEKQRRAVVADLQKHLVRQQYRIELPQSATAEFFQPWVKNVWYRTDAWADADAVKFAWLDK